MPADALNLGRDIVHRCLALGFARAGVCEAAPSGREGELCAWLEGGRHGTMGWMEDHLAERCDPRRVLPGARSMILVADQYASRNDPPDERRRGAGRIARYARGRDYHRVMKKRLHALADELRAAHPEQEFRAFVDTAPVLEREHALRAGLGWIGKHTLLIHPRDGSYFALGGVLTTLAIEPPQEQERVADHCGSCTRCIDACPTDAITPYSVDARRCISYLTIEQREPIDPAFHEAMGDWLFGCDICQEVCPHNSPRGQGAPVAPGRSGYAPRREGFDLLEVLGWTEADRREAFTTSAMKRATLAMMRRNAVICAANALREQASGARGRGSDSAAPPLAHALCNRLREIAADEQEEKMVRDAAREAQRSLGEATQPR